MGSLEGVVWCVWEQHWWPDERLNTSGNETRALVTAVVLVSPKAFRWILVILRLCIWECSLRLVEEYWSGYCDGIVNLCRQGPSLCQKLLPGRQHTLVGLIHTIGYCKRISWIDYRESHHVMNTWVSKSCCSDRWEIRDSDRLGSLHKYVVAYISLHHVILWNCMSSYSIIVCVVGTLYQIHPYLRLSAFCTIYATYSYRYSRTTLLAA